MKRNVTMKPCKCCLVYQHKSIAFDDDSVFIVCAKIENATSEPVLGKWLNLLESSSAPKRKRQPSGAQKKKEKVQ